MTVFAPNPSQRHEAPHLPVLQEEVLHYMRPTDGEVYLDGTFGAGGHSSALLAAANCRVIGLDRDPTAQHYAEEVEKLYPQRLALLPGCFSQMKPLLEASGLAKKVDGVLLDVGVSSMQIDTPRRGFSFMHDGPLDMRMGEGGLSAEDVLHDCDEKELAGALFKYGGEHRSRTIARAIVCARRKAPITRTRQLAEIIEHVSPRSHDGIHPATRTFQALRIWVNNELEELEQGLAGALEVLKPGGRLVVISFHSGEDAIVKRFMRTHAGRLPNVSRYQPLPLEQQASVPVLQLLSSNAVKPTEDEVRRNPRSRSARLRAAIKQPMKEGG